MRRTASEILSDLEIRIARLERQSAAKFKSTHYMGGRRGYNHLDLSMSQIVNMVIEEGFDTVVTFFSSYDEILFTHDSGLSAGVQLRVRGAERHFGKILNAIGRKGGQSLKIKNH